MTDQPSDRKKTPRELNELKQSPRGNDALCWPFAAGSQNDTDKAVKLKPYVPPKRRTLNQY